MKSDLLLWIPVAVPWAAALLIFLSSRRPNLREFWTFAAALIQCLVTVLLLNRYLDGQTQMLTLFSAGPLSLTLRVDAAGLIFALLSSILWVVTTFYAIGYLRTNALKNQSIFFASFAVCLGAASGIAFAGNLLSFVFFYEVLTLATYPLVIHLRTPEAASAGRKYLAYTLGGGQALLVAAVGAHVVSAGAGFTAGGFLSGDMSMGVLWGLFILFILGVGVKSAIMPLHSWLPAAMVAPVPVSALLHAVAVVKAGAFGVLRVTGFVFGPDLLRAMHADILLITLASVTIIAGSLRALGEKDLKKLLAYSTVSQLSYIVLGAGLGSPAAFAGAFFHMAAHGFMKITLFFCAGVIYTQLHQLDIRELGGAARRLPITMTAFAIGAMGLAGLPLIAGFISKWNLGVGALQASHGLVIAVLVASALLNFSYFFPIIYRAFAGKPKERFSLDNATPLLWGPLAFTALASLILGLWPGLGVNFYDLAWTAARAVTGGLP